MSKKQTAVEWLLQWYIDNPFAYPKQAFDAFEKAKQMEKYQITAAYRVGKVEATFHPEILTTGEQYYNETYERATDPDQDY